MSVEQLPALNATLNGIAAVFLASGYWAIRSGRRDLHRTLMICALAVSATFLSCYLYYHFNVQLITHYQRQDWTRPLYFLILITHVPLAGLMTPFILLAVWHAARGRFDRHVRLVKWVWPVWMYVSVTGVIIYLMLYQL